MYIVHVPEWQGNILHNLNANSPKNKHTNVQIEH